ncbi:hypothetical protein KSP24_01435 [Paenibacillus sp. AK121]|uniref:hypothetical protein n=1 Tax=Paenibacillus sp. AK121 TaxID=2849670 RepID=UPI001C24FAC4|nr:hypothetical protein [Paenibacillus sp. AK121]MBU9705587.1 hypothetical protein [Paenibacillus sp. AK121]
MEIHVKENAINSFEVGLNFYNKFLDNPNSLDISVAHYGNLKFAVIAIHNSLELLTKAILLDINELLVFETDIENDIHLCNLLRDQYDSKRKHAHFAYHSVFSDAPYITIGYNKSIKLLMKIFGDKLDDRNNYTLIKMSEYRNTLTHLGYASVFEWYKILVEINNALEIVLTFYIENLIDIKRYFGNELIEATKNILEKSENYIQEVWMASKEYVLSEVNERIDVVLNNELIEVNNIEEKEEYGFFKSVNFNYKEKIYNWKFLYSYLNEAILIHDNDKHIVACISIEDQNVQYSYKDGLPNEIKNVYVFVPKKRTICEAKTIFNLNSKDKYDRFDLDSKQLIAIISKYIKNLSYA